MGSSFEVASETDGYRLRFKDWADFIVSVDGSVIEACPFPDVSTETIRHLLQDQVIPVALSMKGETVLHASGVDVDGGAFAFLGASGSGKSTLAASFARRGFEVLSDDALRLVAGADGFDVFASYPGVRLWPDSVEVVGAGGRVAGRVRANSDKVRWVPDGSAPAVVSRRLRHVFCLGPPDERCTSVRISLLSGRERFLAALAQQFTLPVDQVQRAPEALDQLSRLITSCPFWGVTYPHEFDRLDEVLDAILKVAQ